MVIQLSQRGFIDGKLELIRLIVVKNHENDFSSPIIEAEKSYFRSIVGALQ